MSDCGHVIQLGTGLEPCDRPADGHTRHHVLVWGQDGVSEIEWTLMPAAEALRRVKEAGL